jgi:hypothetical protein
MVYALVERDASSTRPHKSTDKTATDHSIQSQIMSKTHIGLALLAFAAFGQATAAHDGPVRSGVHDTRPAFIFSTIDVPGATSTFAAGMNSRGDIAGDYRDASGKFHGYLLSDGVLTTFDYPGAVYTDARGINARGEIVGAYKRSGERRVDFHGYLRTRDGDFLPVDFPGHLNTIPQRILSNGWILGCRRAHRRKFAGPPRRPGRPGAENGH